jgi:hypothetical protein
MDQMGTSAIAARMNLTRTIPITLGCRTTRKGVKKNEHRKVAERLSFKAAELSAKEQSLLLFQR